MSVVPDYTRRRLLPRILLAYLLVPPVAPLTLLFASGSRWSGSWLSWLALLSIFAFAAMFLLGTPLLYVFLRLRLTGLVPFMAAGAFCAALTDNFMESGPRQYWLLALYAGSGAVAGLAFRFILFGITPVFFRSAPSAPGRHSAANAPAVIASLFVLAAVLTIYAHSTHHTFLTERMGCTCASVIDNPNDKFRPHVEELKLWFVKNPNYEERLFGPHLCQQLKISGASSAEGTFDTYRNPQTGRSAYRLTRIFIAGNACQIFGNGLSSFQPSPGHPVQYTDSNDTRGRSNFPLNPK